MNRSLLLGIANTLTSEASRLTAEIELATQFLAQSLLAEGRILCCGNGVGGLAASFLATTLMHRLDHERPALPAICLNDSAALLGGITRDTHFGETFSRQIRALAHRTDMLVAFTTDGRCPNVIQAIQAMHDKDGRVIVVSLQRDSDLSPLLTSEDLEIYIDTASRSVASACLFAIASALSAGLEELLFSHH